MSASSISETAWASAFVARLTALGVATPPEELFAKARKLWSLIGDVDPDAVAKQEFKGWVLLLNPQ